MCRLMDQQALQEQFKELEYLAADFLEREDFESAAKCYQHLILDDPDDARAYYNLAIVLHDLSMFDESLACYEQAIKLGYDNIARAIFCARLICLSKNIKSINNIVEDNPERSINNEKYLKLSVAISAGSLLLTINDTAKVITPGVHLIGFREFISCISFN